jgi:hypothetical protein
MKRAHRSTPGTATERHPQSTREHDRDVEPVSYFNDAVFAIAMTLLVVSIRVPSGTSAETLGRALRGLGSSFTSYGISFIVIGLYWLAFHRQLHYLERFDGTTLVIDLLFFDERRIPSIPYPAAERVLRVDLRRLLRFKHGRKRSVARATLDVSRPAPTREERRCAAEPVLHGSRSLPSADLLAFDPSRSGGPTGS